MQKFQLPPIHREKDDFYHVYSFLLSGSPSADAACTVFLFGMDSVFYCKLGARIFTKIRRDGCLLSATIFQGKMYYIATGSSLHCAQLQQREKRLLEFRECIEGEKLEALLIHPGTFHRFFNLIACGDQLLCIQGSRLDMGAVEFEIFRADLSGKAWVEVDNIGEDRAIFLDQYGGFSAPVPPGGELKGNYIYYTPEHDNDDEEDTNVTLFGYDLEDQSVSVFSPLSFKMQAVWRPAPELRWIQVATSI